MGNTGSCFGKPPAPAETSSRCTTPTATAAHNFIVENYSLQEARALNAGGLKGTTGTGVGKFVSSTTFSAGGRNWNIRFYPEGDGREPGYASAFLHLVGPAPAGASTGAVKAKFTLSLLGQDGKVYRELKPVSIAATFETAGVKSSWGVIKFVEKATLQEAGCFTVRCDLTVLEEAVVHKM